MDDEISKVRILDRPSLTANILHSLIMMMILVIRMMTFMMVLVNLIMMMMTFIILAKMIVWVLWMLSPDWPLSLASSDQFSSHASLLRQSFTNGTDHIILTPCDIFGRHDICQNFSRPVFLGPKFYTKTHKLEWWQIWRRKKQRKYFKILKITPTSTQYV